jgi:tRNA(His) 5'-end guanylyltransferase
MSITRDDFGNRMKEYEKRNQYFLQKRTPVIIRVDMRAGHTFTKGMKKPFDNVFMHSMHQTMKYMCENIENAVFSYCQSDEITLILCDYQTLNTDCWFNYRTDKLTSISASMATMIFNKVFAQTVQKYIFDYKTSMVPQSVEIQEAEHKYHDTLQNAVEKGAMFDARCFNIPKEEVTNLVYWRQLDAIRNSIQSCGQAYFSQKKLEGKNTQEIKDMLYAEKHMTWANLPLSYQRGVACYKSPLGWYIDHQIPLFTKEGREYIDRLIVFD